MSESPGDRKPPHLAFLPARERAGLRDLSPRKQAVQQRSRETVEVILEGAAQVFEQHGFQDATTDQIAERAGVSVGSVYQYFASKEALAFAWMERHGQQGIDCMLPVLRRLQESPPSLEQGVRLLVDALVEPHRTRPELHRVLADQAPIPPAVRERKRKLPAAMAPVLEQWLRVARPEGGPGPDPALAAAVLAACAGDLVHGLTAQPSDACPIEQVANELERMLLGYLRSEAPPR